MSLSTEAEREALVKTAVAMNDIFAQVAAEVQGRVSVHCGLPDSLWPSALLAAFHRATASVHMAAFGPKMDPETRESKVRELSCRLDRVMEIAGLDPAFTRDVHREEVVDDAVRDQRMAVTDIKKALNDKELRTRMVATVSQACDGIAFDSLHLVAQRVRGEMHRHFRDGEIAEQLLPTSIFRSLLWMFAIFHVESYGPQNLDPDQKGELMRRIVKTLGTYVSETVMRDESLTDPTRGIRIEAGKEGG